MSQAIFLHFLQPHVGHSKALPSFWHGKGSAGEKGEGQSAFAQLKGPERKETACADHMDNHEPEQKVALTGVREREHGYGDRESEALPRRGC